MNRTRSLHKNHQTRGAALQRNQSNETKAKQMMVVRNLLMSASDDPAVLLPRVPTRPALGRRSDCGVDAPAQSRSLAQATWRICLDLTSTTSFSRFRCFPRSKPKVSGSSCLILLDIRTMDAVCGRGFDLIAADQRSCSGIKDHRLYGTWPAS